MAMEAQGVQIHVLATTPTTLTTNVTIAATCVTGTGSNFGGAGFTTAMWVMLSSASTEMHRVKSITGAGTSVINIHGSFTSIGAAAGAEVRGYTSTFIGEVTDFTGPGGAAQVIDVTSLQSTAKEKLVGLRDEGQLSLTMNFNATDDGQTKLLTDRAARQQRKYAIVFTDISSGSSAYPSWCYFSGYAMQYSVSGAVDNKVTANAVIEINGPVIYSTKVSV
jgi:hypothetical protein